jgi:O-acetylhomoserine (thiol)-lyase
MTIKQNYHLDTICLHAGQQPDPATGARAVPIYQTTSYVFKDTDTAAALFDLKVPGNIYSRITNPTADVVEQRVAALEGGVGGLLVSSGMAAELIIFSVLAQQGDNIVASSALYGGTKTILGVSLPRFGITGGGTKTILGVSLPRFGITGRFFNVRNPESAASLIDDRTKALYVETIGNPAGDVADLETYARIAHEHDVPLVVDNTFAAYLCRPFEWGADVVFHSATKFIGGHGTSIGGIIVDGGTFPWENGRFPEFVDPAPGYHGLKFRETFKEATFIVKCRVDGLRTLGPAASPFNAFLFLQGLETLHLRVPRHSENAERVARHLAAHPKVAWVSYAGLPGHPSHDLARKYLKGGFGSIFTFGVLGGIEAGKKVIESVRLISHLANVGDAKTLILHPASTSHSQLSDDDKRAAGVTPDLIRLSVGIEHAGDIIADLDQALANI